MFPPSHITVGVFGGIVNLEERCGLLLAAGERSETREASSELMNRKSRADRVQRDGSLYEDIDLSSSSLAYCPVKRDRLSPISDLRSLFSDLLTHLSPEGFA